MVDLDLPETLIWRDDTLHILDQRRLPQQEEYLTVHTLEDACQAIRTLAVRGAPAIGIAAAYALAQSALALQVRDTSRFSQALADNARALKAARPTAVNLAWAVDRILAVAAHNPNPEALVAEACRIHAEDLSICAGIGQHGAPLIESGAGVLTHCNAGSLAVSRLGTATAPMYVQHARGVPFQVYADETRPLYQGARLTAWELDRAGIDVTVLCDNAAAALLASGRVQLVLVGTDRVTANGDVVNKIGTLNVAILCQHYGVPFYVACPSSTFDPHTATGAEVVIEHRGSEEVLGDHAACVPTWNPAFDVTPAGLVTGIITEHGIFQAGTLNQEVAPSQAEQALTRT